MRLSELKWSELHYHLIMGRDTGVIGVNDFATLVAQTIEVRKMLNGLLKRVSASLVNVVSVAASRRIDLIPDTYHLLPLTLFLSQLVLTIGVA